MPAERYYLDHPLTPLTHLLLEGQEFHHMAHVMRGAPGDHLELVNGQGTLAKGVIKKISKRHAEIDILESMTEEKSTLAIVLMQAIPRANRLDTILEKATELGATEICLFPSAHSERRGLSEHQIERMRSLTIAALKQCGRLFLPEIRFLPPLLQWKDLSKNTYFGDVDPEASLFQKQWEKGLHHIHFITGPESGFSDEETLHLKNLGAVGVKLHANILRTDTASLMALSLISHWTL